MQFNMREWRRMYDNITEAGQLIKDSRVDYEGNPPKHHLSADTKYNLNATIKNNLRAIKVYFKACKMHCPRPLWYYDVKDTKTWYSHESFAYSHKVKYK